MFVGECVRTILATQLDAIINCQITNCVRFVQQLWPDPAAESQLKLLLMASGVDFGSVPKALKHSWRCKSTQTYSQSHTHTHSMWHIPHTHRGRDEGRQACIWFAHRTTHFVGYLFWSYAHLALASKIECGSNEKLREKRGEREREHEKGIKGKRQKAKGCKRIGKCARIRRKPKHSAKQTNE